MTKMMAVILALLCMAPLPAFAQTDEFTEPCKQENILGVWDMIKLSANYAYDKNNAWFYPHQLMVFEKDGTFKLYTSADDIPDAQKKELLAMLPKGQTYKMDAGGQLSTENKAASDTMAYLCLIFTKDHEANKKGDILLAAGRKGGAIAVKALRKSTVQE